MLKAPNIPPEVLAIVRKQIAALARIEPRHRAKLLAISRDIRAALERQLKTLAPGRYTTQQMRVVLVQARAIADILGAEFGQRIGVELQALGSAAATVGRDSLAEQIVAWSSKHPGAFNHVVPLEAAADVLDKGLIEYYRVSRETYGMEAITKMRAVMSRGSLAGQTIAQTWEQMAPAVGMPEWKAERIVRTEQSFALHRRQALDMHEMFGDRVGEWRKELVATLDGRTGQDSIFVNHQTRKINEPFVDNIGNVYQHPPNRPNDREVVVYVPAQVDIAAEASPTA